MAGKRLLDLANLITATRSIAKRHVGLRQQQWDVYSRTSSLAKAVRDQTDRVTVTAKAGLELARRLDETRPSYQATRGGEEHGRGGDGVRERGARSRPEEAGFESSPIEAVRHDVATGYPAVKRTSGQPEEVTERPSDTARRKEDRDVSDNTTTEARASAISQIQEEELPHGVNLEGLFTSQRVSGDIGAGKSYTKQPYGPRKKLPPQPLPEMRRAEEERKRQLAEASMASTTPSAEKTPTTIVKDDPERGRADEATVQEAEPSRKSSAQGDAETQELAESIAQSSASSPPATGEAPTEYEMHESRVPSSRFGRLWQYSGLATSMAFGAVGESFRRFTGGTSEGSVMLSEANINRLVTKLSRMRGAALKLGQMISFQDSKMLPPTINTILQRVQDSADYMPASQRDNVLRDSLGKDWRDLFSHFEEKPFAAASIGQVHKATLASNGNAVAVKVQYPGVRNSIDSDLNNLALLLTASRLLPRGLFLDKTIDNARTELAWECDYEREAQACIRFKELLKEENDIFTVPAIYTEASGPGVLTAEFLTGTAVTKMKDLSQADRDWVGTQILRLCLRELMEWRFMQTDPNWTNFLYNRSSQKLELLDFGASREFPAEFVEPYVALLIAASKNDRDACGDLSIKLGYLTGQESSGMLKAHVDSIMTLAEPFVDSAPEVYDFEDQTITDRVRQNIGLMLKERLQPPPEETYSLHRKLSGSFLLCARLRSRVKARGMFADAVKVWEGRDGRI